MGVIFLWFFLAVVAGCASPPAWRPFEPPGGGLQVSFPSTPEVRSGHEGPLAHVLLAAATGSDGTRYEVAVFRLPRALSASERVELVDRVESGLITGRSRGRHSRGERSLGGETARELEMELPADRLGCWLVFFPDAQRLIQLSVVGPARRCDDRDVGRFFESFRWQPSPAG